MVYCWRRQYRWDFGWTKTKGVCLSRRFLSLSSGGVNIKWAVVTGTGTMSWWKTPDRELDVHPVSPRHAQWTRMFDSGRLFSDCWHVGEESMRDLYLFEHIVVEQYCFANAALSSNGGSGVHITP